MGCHDDPSDLPAHKWSDKPDMVNHPPHYTRGPIVTFEVPNLPFDGQPMPPMTVERALECIEVIRYIDDMRLATAIKYLWRIAFGGKFDNAEDAKKAIWYINDYLEHPVDTAR